MPAWVHTTANWNDTRRSMFTRQTLATVGSLARSYPASILGGWKNRALFQDVGTYCMFIGYPRSGHSLIGALLDAHPHMIIAHELSALKYVHAGFSRMQIYHLLLENSRACAEAGRGASGYSYQVPNQSQGRFEELRIIGDKQAQGATLRLQATPRLCQRLYSRIDSRIGFIHVMRNPYDNISTMLRRAEGKGQRAELADCIDQYFDLCQAVSEIKDHIPNADLFELRHESFASSPRTHLRQLCSFLGVEAPEDYVRDCESIVYSSPHKSRYETQWSRALIEDMERRIDGFPFLHGYSYTS